jgi:hypothetical protein
MSMYRRELTSREQAAMHSDAPGSIVRSHHEGHGYPEFAERDALEYVKRVPSRWISSAERFQARTSG